PCARAARVLQGAGLCRVRRRAADHRVAQGATQRPARSRALASRQAQLPRSADPEAAPKDEMSARSSGRRSYDGVAVAVPVTVPYRRYSTKGAHWFVGAAMDALVEQSGIPKDRIDGLTVS